MCNAAEECTAPQRHTRNRGGMDLNGGKRGWNRTGTSAAIFGLEAAAVGVAYSGEGRDESRGEEIEALGVWLPSGMDIEPPTDLCCWITWLEVWILPIPPRTSFRANGVSARLFQRRRWVMMMMIGFDGVPNL
ncbi:hypothetical protein FJT64_000479 [Amphibalanus amphitrite]|uniref:Uncharacterized protein n=1 Tax=Amphibalanus amphitrite TaxID=1232801 RepID=A0A6A4W7W2_AMPAM|nr:hypothetical protein FJT64_000479 [Amphibalanus amphitrite]